MKKMAAETEASRLTSDDYRSTLMLHDGQFTIMTMAVSTSRMSLKHETLQLELNGRSLWNSAHRNYTCTALDSSAGTSLKSEEMTDVWCTKTCIKKNKL